MCLICFAFGAFMLFSGVVALAFVLELTTRRLLVWALCTAAVVALAIGANALRKRGKRGWPSVLALVALSVTFVPIATAFAFPEQPS